MAEKVNNSAAKHRVRLALVSPTALLEIEEQAQDLIDPNALEGIVRSVYALDVTDWNDSAFDELEGVLDKLIALLSASSVSQYRPYIQRLLEARDGVEQGIAPDPAKRPTASEMRDFVSKHLS